MLEQITSAVRALLPPAPGFFYQLNQERLQRYRARLAEVEAALEALRLEAFAAAARLMSLDAAPVPQLNSYTDIAGPGDAL